MQNIIVKQSFSGVATGQAERVSLNRLRLTAVAEGASTVSATVKIQVTNTPKVEASWIDSGVHVVVSGTSRAQSSDSGLTTYKWCRIVVVNQSAANVVATIVEFDTDEDADEDTPQAFVFLNGTTGATKSDVIQLPSRKPVSFDININGTATVNLYASNIETDANGTKWGTPIRTFTASEKIIIENEPWCNWMIEHASGAGTVFASAGA